MGALLLWLEENVLLLALTAIEGVGLYIWREKNPDKWITWKRKKLAKKKKLRAVNLKQIQNLTQDIERLEKELGEDVRSI